MTVWRGVQHQANDVVDAPAWISGDQSLYNCTMSDRRLVIDTSAILAVLLDEPEKVAVVEATMGRILYAPASIRWEIGNAATAGVKKRRLSIARARQLARDFEQVPIQEHPINILSAVDLAVKHGLYAYDGYILEAARTSGYPLVTLDGGIARIAQKIGVSLVELDV
jgi:predicted nucleic acid-binding protein